MGELSVGTMRSIVGCIQKEAAKLRKAMGALVHDQVQVTDIRPPLYQP